MKDKLISPIKSMDAKKWFILVLLSLFITDLIIILNIPYLRWFIPFLFFTLVPGMLILQIFKLNKIEFIKKLVLWVGLSVSFIIFAGLLLNSLYPLILYPLSLSSVLVTFNLFIIVMVIVAYQRNKNDFKIDDLLFKLNLKDKLNAPLIFPLLLPFMAIIGTYLMNTGGNNTLLLMMLFLIPTYITLLIYWGNRVSYATYPVAILMISMSMLFMNQLSSNHLMGRDIHKEFFLFQLTLNGYHWDVTEFFDTFNACLSVTILPTIYEVLTNINPEYIFKVFITLIGSLVPLGGFIIFKKYLDPKYAFLAALLLIFTSFFAFSSMAIVRQMIAMLFFFLAIFVLLDDDIKGRVKQGLSLILIISIVVTHYSTAYLSLIFILPILFLPFIKSVFFSIKNRKMELDFTNIWLIILIFICLLIWYNFIAYIQINTASSVISSISRLTSGGTGGIVLAENTTDSMVLNIFGIGIKSIPNRISAYVHDAVFISIGLGFIAVLWKYKYYRKKIESAYYLGIFISFALLVSFIFIPYISLNYGAERVLFQSLVFIAPLSIIAAQEISGKVKLPKLDVVIILVLLISLFACNTFLQYHFMGIQQSPYYENDGTVRNEYYIYDQEIISAKWLSDNSISNLTVYSDAYSITRLIYGNQINKLIFDNNLFYYNRSFDVGYIYLRSANVNKGIVYPTVNNPGAILSLDAYKNLFIGRSIIYSNGRSQIWM